MDRGKCSVLYIWRGKTVPMVIKSHKNSYLLWKSSVLQLRIRRISHQIINTSKATQKRREMLCLGPDFVSLLDEIIFIIKIIY